MDKYYNKTIEEARQNFDTELKRLYSDGQKLEHELYITKDKLTKQDKELENYFKAISQTQHLTNIEIGVNERPEYATKRSVPTAQLISIDEDNNEQQEGSKAQGKKRCHVTEKKEIDNDEMQGVTSTTNGNNISMHEKNFETTRKRYYAKINLNTCKLPKEEIETRIGQVFNKERFRIDVLNKNGNLYLYVMFVMTEERIRLTNSVNITENVGKFYTDQEMDTTIEDPLRMIARNILIDYSPSDLNEDFVTVNLGSINQVLNNPPTSMNKNFRHENILLNVMCNDIQLADTWSIPIKGNTHRISIAPCNLTQKQKEERKRYSARLIDVDRDIDYINVHDLLTEAKAKEWHIYDSNKQEKKSIQVFFKTGRDRDNTIRTPCIINNKNFTWIKGSMDHTDSPFGPTNATITIQIIEDRINSYKTEENIITTDKVIDKWTQDKAKEPTTQDTIQIINHDNFSEDFMDLDITELTTLVDRIKINKEDLYQIEEPNISQPIKVLETIRETSITQRSEATEEITTEDTITTTNTQMNRRNKTDTTKIGTQETMMLDTRDKTINTIEKTPKMMPTAIEEMEMDTTIDEQIMTMIEEAEITSIMDIDIESTSSILTREEEMTVV
ncbi:unnamed protein product [Rhizophagus irregularis]|nr:unnamed protein product [Rhizophagus irregularis]